MSAVVLATVVVRNARTGALLGSEVRVAARRWDRLRGLLGHAEPPPGEGLLIEPCNGIHTVGMRYPIDALFLDREGRVLRCAPRLAALRCIPWVRGARRVLELPAGTIAGTRTVTGDLVTITAGAGRVQRDERKEQAR